MEPAGSLLDWAPLLLVLALAAACGLAAAGRRGAAELLKSRPLPAWLLTASLLGILAPILGGAALAIGDGWMHFAHRAFDFGFPLLAAAVGLAIAAVLHWMFLSPLQAKLAAATPWEYLELRYSPAVRRAAAGAWLLWQFITLVFVLAAPAAVAGVLPGPVPGWLLVALLGITATGIACLGGIRAAVNSSALMACVFTGVALLFTLVITNAAGGREVILQSAERFGRAVEPSEWSGEDWNRAALAAVWGAAAGFALLFADPLAGLRLTAARSLPQLRWGTFAACAGAAVLLAAGVWSGLGLFVWYHGNSEAVRARWVVNVDPITGDSLRNATGRPLIGWNERLDREYLEGVILYEGRLMHPNRREPVTDLAEFLDPATGAVRFDALGARRPPPEGELGLGELVLHRAAREELVPWFSAAHLPAGAAGLLLALLAAQALAYGAAAVQGMSQVWLLDFRRLQPPAAPRPEQAEAVPSWWSKPRIAAAAAGSCATLLALPLVFVPLDLGRAAALWIAPLPPLAVVMLLGVVFRAPTAWSALAALFLGWGVGLLFALLAPGEWVLAAPPAACAAALVAAAISALLPGPRKSREQLRGLVWGLGQIGQRTPEEASPAIAVPDDDRRWR